MISKELLDIIVCPGCKKDLKYSEEKNTLDCMECALEYPITDGIPELLIERASPLKK